MRYSKCPNCGAAMVMEDEIFGKLKCPNCGFEVYSDDNRETHHEIYTDTARLEEARNDRHKFDRMMDIYEREEQEKREAREREQATAYAASVAKELRKGAKRRMIVFLVLVGIFAIFAFKMYSKISHQGDLTAGMSASNYKKIDYMSAERRLRAAGFKDIDIKKYTDLSKGEADKDEIVSMISINGNTSFGQSTYFPKDALVKIEYHVLDPARADEIQVPESNYFLEGKTYAEVQKEFEAAGFTNIILEPLGDVSSISRDRGLVADVYLDGDDHFYSDTWASKDVEVLITYHSTKGDAKEYQEAIEAEKLKKENEGKIQMPKAAVEYVGINYLDVEAFLKSLGFTNITVVPLNDIKTDILKQANKVDDVSINGNDFEEGAYFDPDSPIIIKYHSKQ